MSGFEIEREAIAIRAETFYLGGVDAPDPGDVLWEGDFLRTAAVGLDNEHAVIGIDKIRRLKITGDI